MGAQQFNGQNSSASTIEAIAIQAMTPYMPGTVQVDYRTAISALTRLLAGLPFQYEGNLPFVERIPHRWIPNKCDTYMGRCAEFILDPQTRLQVMVGLRPKDEQLSIVLREGDSFFAYIRERTGRSMCYAARNLAQDGAFLTLEQVRENMLQYIQQGRSPFYNHVYHQWLAAQDQGADLPSSQDQHLNAYI